MATMLPSETPQYAFADIPELNKHLTDPNYKIVKGGSVEYPEINIVAGENFGCGSSREQAVSALTGNSVVVVAKSFARIFKQNAVNLGLKIVTCPDIEASVGDKLDISSTVKNLNTGKEFKTVPLPKSAQAVLDAGGLIPYTKNRLK
jgi:3-isopropylmalate/(R)-2-methylmalate dehydratase small subunit